MERWWLAVSAVLIALCALASSQGDSMLLEWVEMSANNVTLPAGDEDSTEIITQIGFPFGDELKHYIYIHTNGLISFDDPVIFSFFNLPFPNFLTNFAIAPFWDDINTNPSILGGSGEISYEIHEPGSSAMETVSAYVSAQTGADFEGYWMLVVLWDQVAAYFPITNNVNTFQAILIMDSNQNSYAIFIYECGLLQWDNGVNIGYDAGGGHYDNHDPSGSEVACVNYPANNFNNVFYTLHQAPPLPTVPPQNSYFDFVPRTPLATGGQLGTCDDCTSDNIMLGTNFPFGKYYHDSAKVASNGHISFLTGYTHFNAELFPTTNPSIYWDFVLAPFWSDVDLRLEGIVWWETHTLNQSPDLINDVSNFIQENFNGSASSFSGTWMMITTWEDVHPFPHGSGSMTAYTLSTNTFQAILITNGTKSYAVYTYRCGEMEWGDESTIGYNAGADYYQNHPITGHFQSHFISCLQNMSSASLITNVIYDLIPDPASLLPGTIPPIHNTIGSCSAAGFTECCEADDCRGFPLYGSCYCDALCSSRGDCCFDEQYICPTGLLTDDYLILAVDAEVLHMSLNGTDIETLASNVNGRAYGIDYHFANQIMVWSDVENNIINMISLDGTGLVTELVTTDIAAVDDVAIDWIGNNLYWTDGVWSRIEVMSLETRSRVELFRTEPNVNPRAIAVDPTTRYMYWSELGESSSPIKRAYMDGTSPEVLIAFLVQPNGLTIDIEEQKLYWCDTAAGTVVHADLGPDGLQSVNQIELADGTIGQPFSISLSSTSVFWTDWNTATLYSTHKIHGNGEGGHHFTVYTGSAGTPRGVEVVSSSKQPTIGIENPCNNSGCSDICLLSGNSDGYTCATPETTPTTPPEGSCGSAGYTDCCAHGTCGGDPASCFCDTGCYERSDCCTDMFSICNQVPPLNVIDIVAEMTVTTATVSFTIDVLINGDETYRINYGTTTELGLVSSIFVTVNSTGDHTIQIESLNPGTTYHFQISGTNAFGTTLSGIFSNTTLEDAPSGPPTNFIASVDGTTLTASWEPPSPDERNGVIISYNLQCENGDILQLMLNPISTIKLDDLSPNTQYTCRVAASTSAGIGPFTESVSITTGESDSSLNVFTWIPLAVIYGTAQNFLPATDDGFEGPIEISPGFPFGSSVQTQVFVGTNGLISFGTGYNSFSNQAFPGNTATQSRYLVAPFWDDVDIRFDTGEISYEIHESGYFLDQVNSFITSSRPDFEGTWMMVVYYDKVHPYIGLFNPQENTFQAILITDGTYSYTIFTYQCGLMGWDNGATIGYNAAGEMFANHNPSSSAVACLNFPGSIWSNVIYRLSTNSSELPPPTNVEALNTTLNTTIIQWVVTDIDKPQNYTVQYGTSQTDLEFTVGPISSIGGTDQTYQTNLESLVQGTTYYVQVVSEFGIYTLQSDIISFTTLEPANEVAPTNFEAVAVGTSVTFTWTSPVVPQTIVSINLVCHPDSEINIEIKNIGSITLYDLPPETNLSCTLAAASSGGYGPPTPVVYVLTEDAVEADSYFSFIPMDIHINFEQLFFPGTDNGYAVLPIPGGFPFSDTVYTEVYIGSNGILSFGTPYNPFLNQELPVPGQALVAPFWDDIDTRFGSGIISIEVQDSGYFLEEVSEFIRRRRSAVDFTGTWMLIVYWDAVHPYFGFFNDLENTFQAIIITDGTYSYSLFTYKCDLMNWDNGVTIGYSDGADFFFNNVPSTSEVACFNLPVSNFSNIIYRLSSADPEIPPPVNVRVTSITMTDATISWNIPMFTEQEEYIVEYGLSPTDLNLESDTVESITDTTILNQPYSVTLQGLTGSTKYYFRVMAKFGTGGLYVRHTALYAFFTQFEPQYQYLPYLPYRNTSIDSGTLLSCQHCSSFEITFPSDFAFGGYYHQSAYVATDGYITFGVPLIDEVPEAFPPDDPDIYWTYMIAPFWANFDTRMGGTVSWELHTRENSFSLVDLVDAFIAGEYGDTSFAGSWMLVANWKNVQPSLLTQGNTFQAVLTTNGTKSYGVMIYKCDDILLSEPVTIGYYAPTSAAYNHPLSTTAAGALIETHEIACIHSSTSIWSNLIFELEVSNHILEMTPEPHFSTGSCVEAGFTECCTGFACSVEGCFCDSICHFFGDCCFDIDLTCLATDGVAYDILVAHGDHISQIHFEGTSSETVRTDTTGTVVGIDFLFSETSMFWSDITTDTIHRAKLDGTGEVVLIDTCISTVDDIAVDWVSHKLYWTDSVWARIEALDLSTNFRVEVLTTGANTVPRAIAVDPVNRVMFWTDYGVVAKIETAGMDGGERRTLHFNDISQPNGIAIDYGSSRIYWSDAGQDTLEYSNFDGSGRTVLETAATGLLDPFAVTVIDDVLFWSDWATNKIYATHKEHGAGGNEGYFNEIVHFLDRPYGIEALRADQQPEADNPCLNSECSHVCLLTFVNESGFTCACPEGFEFENDTYCKLKEGPQTPCATTPGSCAAYATCCEEGFCAGSPANCFCDDDCRIRGDCCSDINNTCIEGWPRLPRDISVIENTGLSVTITWLIPYIASTPETYTISYGANPDNLNLFTAASNGTNTSLVDQTYSRSLPGLAYITTYYFKITVTNDVGSVSTEVFTFTTAEGAPSAAPINFVVSVSDTEVCLAWDPPPEDQQNGVLTYYKLICSVSSNNNYEKTVKPHISGSCFDNRVGNEDLSCTVAASTGAGEGPSTAAVSVTTAATDSGVLKMLVLNATVGVDQEILPESDEGTYGPITLPTYGFPFWSSDREQVYIAINGLLAFEQPYGSFFNQPFPGNFFISFRYLVAPFWDDADTRGGGGEISYEVHTSGYLLDHISAFLRVQRPSTFQGTWMLVVFYDAVNPYFGTGENTYQVILVTDGSSTYTIFTYDCNLMGWGTSATIGFSAAGEVFENNEYTSTAIACSNLPQSITNVIYRLSENNPEYALPTDVNVLNILETSVTIEWVVPSVTQQQQYTILYGTTPQNLDQTSATVVGNSDTSLLNQQYSVTVASLQEGTTYYFKISVTFDDVTFATEVYEFRTLDPPPTTPPHNFTIMVTRVAVSLEWNPPPDTTGVITSYTLFCSIDGEEVLRVRMKTVQFFTLEELNTATLYSCGMLASTSGGDGPPAVFSFETEDVPASIFTLPFVAMNTLLGVEQTIFPGGDEDTYGPLELNGGFPFGSTTQTNTWVAVNGLLSFGSSYNSFFNQPFPGSSTINTRYLVAPFWDDIDTRYSGQISYEVHETGYYLDEVNLFLKRNRPSQFQGTWMMVTYWDAVRPYFGLFNTQENTFQAFLVSDGTYSYAIFTYKCGEMEWDRGPTIGYNAGGEKFSNNNPSSSAVACLNTPESDYSNVIYLLSNESPEIPIPKDVTISDVTTTSATVSWTIPSFITPEQYYVAYGTDPDNLNQTSATINSPTDTSLTNLPYSTTLSGLEPGSLHYIQVTAVFDDEFVRYTEILFLTKEPEQTEYLQFLYPNDDTTLEPCDDCSSNEIPFTISDFPFGGYYHQSAYVSTNGLISFGREVSNSNPVLFPSTTVLVARSYIVTPFWADLDTTDGGEVSWWIEEAVSSVSPGIVSDFIQAEYGDDDFSATWILVAHWNDIPPGNTFQAILITDGSKSYAVFTYRCEQLEWSDEATIGINTPDDIIINHPLSGTDLIDEIACIHVDSPWKNLIYELEPNPVILPITPPPSNSLGSCGTAGFTDCCTSSPCFGAPISDCYCDSICRLFGDCCFDIDVTCGDAAAFDVLVGHGHHISQIHYEGDSTETVRTDTSGTVVGVDYSESLSKMYWSDVTTDTIHRANMNGTNEEIIASTNLISVDDIAVDWVSGKLYWTDAGWARIEAMDFSSLIRIELIRTGTNTVPRGIAVDPIRRVIYWTDWGRVAKIEIASMDGSGRRDFVVDDLSQPNGISIDLESERVYWVDSDLDKIEFISFGGTGRMQVETEATGLQHPFALSVGGEALFWSDWDTNAIYATHKEHGADDGLGYFNSIASFDSTPYGVEALIPGRQPSAVNYCDGKNCSHVCLLSESEYFKCSCPLGYELDNPTLCRVSGDFPLPTLPLDGTCGVAGYEYCCEHGFCAGYPATCFCDSYCYKREDCCTDISDTCAEGSPRSAVDIVVLDITATSARIQWTIPFIVSTQESYYVVYGLNSSELTLQSAVQSSGLNVSTVYFQFLSGLDAAEIYYFRVVASNDAGETRSDLESFITSNGPPSGPPLNFAVQVTAVTSLTFSWSPPEVMLQNGAITSYKLACTGDTDVSYTTSQLQFTIDTFVPAATFQCSVLATNEFGDGPPTGVLTVATEYVQPGTPAYLPLVDIGGDLPTVLPPSDEGISSAIPIPGTGFPFWSTSRSSVYVGTNGILSFDSPYGPWFTSVFPGSVSTRYLVAPFWDDADTNYGNGQVSYAVYNTGYYLDYVSAFIRRQNPSDFQGTWMVVAFWDSVRPYYSFFSTQENTYQAILITDGTHSYTVFTYDCNLLEWGGFTVIGFNAGGEAFENNEYTDNSIACSSLPASSITNAVYRLSGASPEYPPPQNVQISGIEFTFATVSWFVPYVPEQQAYTVRYGLEPNVLDLTWGLLISSQAENQTYSITVQGLTQGTDYYFRVSSTFGYSIIYSDLVSFTTLDPPPTGPPLNFTIDVTGTTLDLSWEQPSLEQRGGLIRYYTLTCTPDGEGEEPKTFLLNNVTVFSLDDFRKGTQYNCTLYASTSGGSGPTTSATASTDTDVGDDIFLPLIRAGSLREVESVQFEEVDDGTSDAIDTPPFPFGDSIQDTVYVGSNGILSFGSPYNPWSNSPFTEFGAEYVVAPFWDDINIAGDNGEIFYEIHESGYFLDQVNAFLQQRRPSFNNFTGTWMLVAYWDAVRPFSFIGDERENTFEAILITDGTVSYTIFTYQCGLMNWDNGATIGFKGSDDFYANHDPSTSNVACLNDPTSSYSSIIYLLSNTSTEIPLPDMVATEPQTNTVVVSWRIPRFLTLERYYIRYGTDQYKLSQQSSSIPSAPDIVDNTTYSLTLTGLEPGTIYYLRVVAVFGMFSKRQSDIAIFRTKEDEQAYYLEYLDIVDGASEVEPCSDGCSSPEIELLYDFPFGGYYHKTAYVNTNGLITFGDTISGDVPAPQTFPTSFWTYAVAPFWQNFNTTGEGRVLWKMTNDSFFLDMVNKLIQDEYGDTDFNGLWMLVASWEDVIVVGDSNVNKFQAVLISSGTKAYAVFTYKCGDTQWPGAFEIGYSAPPTTFYNHPLSFGEFEFSELSCAHLVSPWNNIIIDLQPGNTILPSTPQPPVFTGSCREAGYTDCCTSGSCFGAPIGSLPCYCDFICIFFGDCCFDASHSCHAPTYDLLVGNGDHVSKIHFEGTASETVQTVSNGSVVGVDFHASRSLMFWSDTLRDTIHQANISGDNDIVLVDTDILAVDDIAVDWIANNLYWVDSVWARIEALNLDSMERAEVLRLGANTRPRAIAVDSSNRVMFWTDWGMTAKIERAYMDGEERRTVHQTDLSQPNGITIDYAMQKIYWSDSDLDRIEYSSYDGSERTVLESLDDGLLHPFGLTIANELLFWTDWETNYLYYTHKDHGNTEGLGIFQALAHFTSTPYGVEALVDSRQASGENPCEGSECDHICLLSGTSASEYTCGCAARSNLQNDDKSCSTAQPPEEGSCVGAGYDRCCSHGFCAGYPATCSCNPDCHNLGDCCADIDSVCTAVNPNEPLDVQVAFLTHIEARIEWTVPFIVFSAETYTLVYSTTQDDLNSVMGDAKFSGTDLTLTDQLYSTLLKDLIPGTTYYYQIKIENTFGMTLTQIYTFSTPIVGPPQNFTIGVIGSETLSFSWGLPLDIDTSEIAYFVIECDPSFQHDITEIVPDSFSVTLTEFLPGTTYTCTVAAKTDAIGAPAMATATTEEAPDVLPFLLLGTTEEGVDVITLPPSDDINSDPIYISGGLPLGVTTHTAAYVGTNGIVSLGEPFYFSASSNFPTANYFIHSANVTAPFWSDVDTRLAGSVSYETHQRGFNAESNAKLERVSGFISARQNISFTASWMLVAHWDKVHPYPHGFYGNSGTSGPYQDFLNSENTYQAIIITDGTLNFVMYTYQCDLMQWSGQGMYATIGYNLNGDYVNHPLSGTSSASAIACLSSGGTEEPVRRRQTSSNWYNQLYQLPSAVDPIQQLRAECIALELLDIQTIGDIGPLATSLGACPPTFNQALLDFRFVFKSDLSTSSLCFSYIFNAGSSGTSSLVCCYTPASNSAPGSLVVGGRYGSSIALYHPAHFAQNYETFDKDFREKCCDSGLCDVFYARRQIDTSIIYVPPFFGWGFGDPHINTMDNTSYTFNGRGEYTLVEVLGTGFVLQGRTEPVSETSNATQFSAFAMGIKEEDLSAEVRLSRGRLVSFINGEDVSITIENGTATGGDNAFYLTRVGENTTRMLFYWEGLAYVFTVTQREDIIDFVLNLDTSLRGQTRGLFGNFNNDGTDDFIKPNGITVPYEDVTDQMLHEFGQSWQIIETESLFTYPPEMSFSDFVFPDHIPPLLSQVVASAPDDIVSNCAGNEQCIFDAVQTGDPNIGMGTLNTITNNNEDVVVANNFPPSLSGSNSFRVTVGSPSVYTFTAVDTDGVAISIQGPGTDDHTLIPNGNSYTLTISVDASFDYEIMIVATDAVGAVSTLSPRVEICACRNGGECTLDGLLGIDTNVVDMLCQCDPAWHGRYCELDKNGCSELICFQGVECFDVVVPGTGAVCDACPSGYVGDGEKCTDVDECNGTSICQQVCINTPGSFECGCEQGYELSGTTDCIDVNECALELDNCPQICTNTPSSFRCSCQAGFKLDDDDISCNILQPCQMDTVPCDNGQCVVVNGAPVCVCNNGYTLDSSGQNCMDTNECQNGVCEDRCKNTEGSFECDCRDGYTLGQDQRKCEDIDECIQIDNPVCSGKLVCVNNLGSYTCECPAGTTLTNGDCVEDEITEPPVNVIPTEKPPADTTLGRKNSVNVTLRISKEEFGLSDQFKFKLNVASRVNLYCLNKPSECGSDKIEVDSSDVIILDEIVNNANGKATFLLYVYTKNPTDVLNGKVLELILPSVSGVGTVAPVISEEGSGSSGGLSGGEVTAIVIVILMVLIGVLIATIIILWKMKIVPKPPMMTNLSDIFRSRDRRSSMLIEEGYDGESMKDTASVSGVEAAKAKATEAAGEKEEEQEEVKVDLSKEEEAEEAV